MDIPALARVHEYKNMVDNPGIMPGTRLPIKISEAVLFSYGTREFLAYERADNGHIFLCNADKRYNHLFVVGDTLLDAILKWEGEFEKHGGDGL